MLVLWQLDLEQIIIHRNKEFEMANIEKLVEELGKLSVIEAAELVKKLEEAWGVSAAAPVAVAAAGNAPAAVEAVEEKTEFDVVIKEAGPKKIEVIKAIRQLTNLGLGEAKTLAETAGGVVMSQVGKDAANDAKKKLEEAGATVVLA
jgi:large subunit ribosomal protein L7/L12